jgi:hypothetical protein
VNPQGSPGKAGVVQDQVMLPGLVMQAQVFFNSFFECHRSFPYFLGSLRDSINAISISRIMQKPRVLKLIILPPV